MQIESELTPSQAYISGHALVILTGAQTLLQTIYVDDSESLETIAIDESSGQIAVSSGPDVYIYRPNGFKGESLKVGISLRRNTTTGFELIYGMGISGHLPLPFAQKTMMRRSIHYHGAPRRNCSWPIRAFPCGF